MGITLSFTGIMTALFMSIFSTFYTTQQHTRAMQPIETKQCKAIVFDLGGVVVDTCKKKTAWEIGPKILFDYWRNAKSAQEIGKLRDRLYAMLHAANPHATRSKPHLIQNQWNVKDDEGTEVPQLVAEWLRGMKPNQVILDEIKQFAKNNREWFAHPSERRALLNVAHITFTPHRFIKTRKIFDESAELIRECKQRGFKLYVLSNWDRESGKLLVEKHADLFGLFDGIVFSGDVQTTKPEHEIFSYISDEIPADKCVFIDDQAENIDTARDLGFNVILVNHDTKLMGSKPNIQEVRAQLQTINPVDTEKEAYA